MTQRSFFLIASVYIVFNCSVSSWAQQQDTSKTWIWTCDEKESTCNRQLQPDNIPSPTATSNKYVSLDECRLICSQYGSIWPKPSKPIKFAKTTIQIHPDQIQFEVIGAEHTPYLTDLFNLFRNNFKNACPEPCASTSNKMRISIASAPQDIELKWGTNEAYELHVNNNGPQVTAVITAQTIYGVRHALETLLQLMVTVTQGGANYMKILREAHLEDAPAFTHRGVLIDTARHFFSVVTIKRQLDAMAASKLNVLHWHATDSQSFPLVLPSVPQLAMYGAYNANQTYTVQDIKDLHQYARLRGIKIILEIDAPAHAGFGWQWGQQAGLGNLAVCINKQPWRQYCVQPPCGQLNPVNDNLYNVLSSIFKDVLDLFPSAKEVFHMGGDEIHFGCWNSTQEIIDYLQSNNIGRTKRDFLNLWSYYQNRSLTAFDTVNSNQHNTKMIMWTSDLTNDLNFVEKYLKKDRYVIQTWIKKGDDKVTDKLLAKGYQLIVSTKDAWYLDHGVWGNTPYYNWKTVYENRLPSSPLVLGGEVVLWSEFIDEGSIDSRAWPRSAAAAERLWSNPTNAQNVLTRLSKHRDSLVRKGIRADALQPAWCLDNPSSCKNYHNT